MDPFEIQRALKSGLKPLAAIAPLRLSQWADEYFYLSAESSYAEGRWKAYPFQRAIMDCMSRDEIEEVDFMKSARVGYTKMLLALVLYNAEHKHRNQAVWQPTDDDATDFCKTELEPVLRDVPVIQEIFPSFLQRHKDNTLQQKKFIGSILHLRGGKAAKNYRRISIDTSILDELDGFDQDIEKEGSPVNLARKRIEGATYPKLILGSTPRLKGYSHTESRYLAADQRFKFHIPCPHCDQEHALAFGGKDAKFGFKWVGDDPDTVGYLCPHCAAIYTQAEYLTIWERGRYVAEDGTWIDENGNFRGGDGSVVDAPRHVAFHIWTAYSPQATWPQIVREFLSAQTKAQIGDKSELKSFVNLTLGETWEEEVQKTDAHELQMRAEDYRLMTIPMGGLVLVAGVDVQDNRFEVVVWALGYGEEMWVVDYRVIDASPANIRDWAALDLVLASTYEHASGASLRIEAAAVDTGGHFTHQVYNFCRGSWPHEYKGKLFAIKGDTRYSQPIKGRASQQDVNWNGKIIKHGIKLWHVGTDTAKDLLHGRLSVHEPGPGYVHFSKDLPAEFYHQLTAEHRILQKTSQGEVYRWIKSRLRNEALDCTVYAMFCAHALDLHRYTERMWEKLRQAVQPEIADLFAAPALATDPAVKIPPAATLPMNDVASALLAARLARQ